MSRDEYLERVESVTRDTLAKLDHDVLLLRAGGHAKEAERAEHLVKRARRCAERELASLPAKLDARWADFLDELIAKLESSVVD